MAALAGTTAVRSRFAGLVLFLGIVGILLAILEHLVLRLLLPLEVFLHRLLLLALSLSLGATLGVDRVIRLRSSRNGDAEAGDCQEKKDGQSFHG